MKKTMRLISLLLAFVFVLTSFVACSKDEEVDPAGTDNTVEDIFYLLDSDAAACTIVYAAEYEDTNDYSLVKAVHSYVEKAVGKEVTLVSSADYDGKATAVIFIGDTGYGESSAFMSSLKYSDYGFKVFGNTLCIGGHGNTNLGKAVNAFTSLLGKVEKTDSGMAIVPDQCVLNLGEYSHFAINGVDIDKFNIVYGEEAYLESVGKLIKEIGMRTGAVLKAYHVSELPITEYEILVGNTGREITNEFYMKEEHSLANYSVKISGNNVAILAIDELAIECGALALAEKVKSLSLAAADVNVTDADSFDGTFYEEASLKLEARPEGTDVRIAGNNIYFHESQPEHKISVRDDYLYESIRYMDADVLLLQEVIYNWHVVMDPVLETMGYTLVPTSKEDTAYATATGNYTPIWYRANKLELLDYGYKQYDTVAKYQPDSYLSSSKSYTWALFKDKATEKQFITITTHFTWADEAHNPSPNALRVSDANEVIALVDKLAEEYADVPVIFTGDLNSTAGSDPYNVLMQRFSDVRKNAEASNGTSNGTTHSVGSSSIGGAIIDHTLYTGDIGLKMYQHVYNEWAIKSTDHIPLVLDIELK